jgi:tripartite-type tricarboxylate transporter receptor subunit TctC
MTHDGMSGSVAFSLASVMSGTRPPNALDIPTFVEMGLPVLSYSDWVALFEPKGTPREIIRTLLA